MNGISLFLESQYSKVLIDWTGVYWSFFFPPESIHRKSPTFRLQPWKIKIAYTFYSFNCKKKKKKVIGLDLGGHLKILDAKRSN